MDPKANLRRQRELAALLLAAKPVDDIDPHDVLELAELVVTLDVWREKGGFAYEDVALVSSTVQFMTGVISLFVGENGDITPEDFDRLVQVVSDANADLKDEQLQRIETVLDITLMAVEGLAPPQSTGDDA